jgi:hypothetical protein
MQRQGRLLLARLDRHEPHRLACDRFADRLRVGGIILSPLHIGLHVSCGHQPHFMTQLGQFARPVMRRPASLGTDQARWQLLEEPQHLRSSQRLANYNLSACADTVNLKNVLGQIQADRANLHGGWLLCSGCMTAAHLGT